MHHGIGANRDIFAGWLPALTERYRILRFDMRGHGESARSDTATEIDIVRLTDDLLAAMDAAGVDRAHLLGESIGGTIAGEGMQARSAFMMRARFHDGALSPEAWRWFESQQAAACPHTVPRMLHALVGADLAGSLPGLRPPLLLLHPDGSAFIPIPIMSAFRDLVPGSRLHVVGHAKHGLPFSRAAVCSAVFANFLAEQALSVLTAPAGDTR